MADSAKESPHPLVNKVLDSKPPIAKLIDFEVERGAAGHAIAVLETGPQHANPAKRQPKYPRGFESYRPRHLTA